jgi:hypothetical protein
MAALASLETLQLEGRQSLIILVTMEVGRFKSSGLSAILCKYPQKTKSKRPKKAAIGSLYRIRYLSRPKIV